MLSRILALLVGAVLLSLGLSIWLDANILAALAFIAAAIKKLWPAVLLFGRRWVTAFFLKVIPKKLATFLATKGLISQKAKRSISGHIALRRQQVTNRFTFWKTLSFLTRATVLMIFMGSVLLGTFLLFDLWLLLVWLPRELEAIVAPIWRGVISWLANSTTFKLLTRAYRYLTNTWIGRAVSSCLEWCDENIGQPVERFGTYSRKRFIPSADAWLESLPTIEIKLPTVGRHRPPKSPFAENGHIVQMRRYNIGQTTKHIMTGRRRPPSRKPRR